MRIGETGKADKTERRESKIEKQKTEDKIKHHKYEIAISWL